MGRKWRGAAWDDDEEELPPPVRSRRGRGRGDRPGRERRKPPRDHTAAQPALPAGRTARRNVDPDEYLFAEVAAPPVKRVCGLCRHWLDRDVPDGRGECDHPGSGVLFPYNDTPACQFFARR